MRTAKSFFVPICSIAFFWGCGSLPLHAQMQKSVEITVDWTQLRTPLQTTPTLQVVVNPMLRRGSPIHDAAFQSLHNFGGDYVRYVPWLPYPKLAVAELGPPEAGKTSWDFSLIDPMTEDFISATQGHSVILNFSTHPEMFEYFLNHANHRAGIPLDMISYHFYATPTPEQTIDHWQYTFFDQADKFLATVRYIEAIRKRLSPETRTTLDEIGTILPTDWHPNHPNAAGPSISSAYWNASGALYAYVFVETAKLGIDVLGESQLVGYPSQFPSVTMVDSNTGKPNARMRVLELIHQNFSSGSTLVSTKIPTSDVDAQAFTTSTGKKLLLVNKRNRAIAVALPKEFANSHAAIVDVTTGARAPAATLQSKRQLTLQPFAVCVLTAQP